MSTSQFCVRQRHKEQQRLKKLLIFGFAGSAVLHGMMAYALPYLSFKTPKQAQKPMEITIVEKPKPEPVPEPKVESKPVVESEPKPEPKPEPVEAKTPPPPTNPPEPIKAQTAPKPAPKKVLTTPTPAPSQPIVSAPVENTVRSSSFSNGFAAPSNSVATSSNGSGISGSGKPGSGVSGSRTGVAANNAPPRPETSSSNEEGISCVSNCEPEYPATLEGTEGSAGVELTIDSSGNVIGAELSEPNSDSGVNRQALLAARQMQFNSPGESAASVQVKIDFTVEGSEYDRLAREEQARKERAARERQEQEAARQQQLEAEKQAQQERLEQERQARQQQLEQEQTESAPPPAAGTKPAPKPLPALSEEELDEERLRKFKERMDRYREE